MLLRPFFFERMLLRPFKLVMCANGMKKPAGFFAPFCRSPEQVWVDISVDFITGLPCSEGKDTFLVVVDRLSKYAHFIASSHPYSAKGIAEVLVQNVVKLHGISKFIVSDRDRIFISAFWRELFKLQSTQLKMSSSYEQIVVVNTDWSSILAVFPTNS